jgi:cyclophilin family peptidyl-prolyl cis-trans isomerase
MIKKLSFAALVTAAACMVTGCDSAPANADVKISTDYGDVYVDLYDDTPKHKDNFLKLAREGFFDGSTFHRVIQEFMVQGGDPNTKDGSGPAGQGGPGYTLPREIVPAHYHKVGALCAARMPDGANPNWESSGSQFYLVSGKKWTDPELDMIEQQVAASIEAHVSALWQSDPKNGWVRMVDMPALQASNPDSFALVDARIKAEYGAFRQQWPTVKFSPEMRETYRSKGGVPFLDGTYTVFGEVVGGMEVLMEMEKAKTLPGDVPEKEIKMTVSVLK